MCSRLVQTQLVLIVLMLISLTAGGIIVNIQTKDKEHVPVNIWAQKQIKPSRDERQYVFHSVSITKYLIIKYLALWDGTSNTFKCKLLSRKKYEENNCTECTSSKLIKFLQKKIKRTKNEAQRINFCTHILISRDLCRHKTRCTSKLLKFLQKKIKRTKIEEKRMKFCAHKLFVRDLFRGMAKLNQSSSYQSIQICCQKWNKFGLCDCSFNVTFPFIYSDIILHLLISIRSRNGEILPLNIYIIIKYLKKVVSIVIDRTSYLNKQHISDILHDLGNLDNFNDLHHAGNQDTPFDLGNEDNQSNQGNWGNPSVNEGVDNVLHQVICEFLVLEHNSSETKKSIQDESFKTYSPYDSENNIFTGLKRKLLSTVLEKQNSSQTKNYTQLAANINVTMHSGKPLSFKRNETMKNQTTQIVFQRISLKNNIDAQWGILCITAIVLLALFASLYNGMFNRCKRNDVYVDFHDGMTKMEVNDLVRRKVLYLPIFRRVIKKMMREKEEDEKRLLERLKEESDEEYYAD